MKTSRKKCNRTIRFIVATLIVLGSSLPFAFKYLRIERACHELRMFSDLSELQFLNQYGSEVLFEDGSDGKAVSSYCAKLLYHGNSVTVEAYQFSTKEAAMTWYGGDHYEPIWPQDRCDWKCPGVYPFVPVVIKFYQDQFGVEIRAQNSSVLIRFLQEWNSNLDIPFRYTPFLRDAKVEDLG